MLSKKIEQIEKNQKKNNLKLEKMKDIKNKPKNKNRTKMI